MPIEEEGPPAGPDQQPDEQSIILRALPRFPVNLGSPVKVLSKSLFPVLQPASPLASGISAPPGTFFAARPPTLALPAPDVEAPPAIHWTVDGEWLATARTHGAVVSELQLDPGTGVAASPQSWQQRFNRREEQIRLGKRTRGYRVWFQHWTAQGGRQPGDPETPRAARQCSKSEFEREYRTWRIDLHRSPGQSVD